MANDEPKPIAHTVILHDGFDTHIQHYGPSHVVDGSERVIDLPPGYTLVIRHVSATEQKVIHDY